MPDDFLRGDADLAIVSLQGGDDLLLGGDGDDTLFGDVLSSIPGVTVSGGDDILLGGDGDDLLWGDGNIGFSPGPSQAATTFCSAAPSATMWSEISHKARTSWVFHP